MFRIILAVCIVACLGSVSAEASFLDPPSFGPPSETPGLPGGIGPLSVTASGDYMVFVPGAAPHTLSEAKWNDSLDTWDMISNISPLGSGGRGWESAPSLSPDGEWLFYNATNGTDEGCLYRSTRQLDDSWGPGELVPGLDQVGRESESHFNGTHLFFNRFDSGGSGPADFYVSEYDPNTDTFGTPALLNAEINDGSSNRQMYVDPAGMAMLFSSNRVSGQFEIWLSEWDSLDNKWGSPTIPVWTVDDPNAPGILDSYSPETQTLYFREEGVAGPSLQSVAIPEPTSLVLILVGLMGTSFGVCRSRRTCKC